MKKVVFITAPEVFRDEEYYKPKKILEDAGIQVLTASIKKGEITGRFGYKAVSDMTIDEVKPENFDAIVYIGGAGAQVFFENPVALKLANGFYNSKKITASICIAGVTLANAGVLKDKTATVFIDGKDSLVKGGANYTGNPLEIDGNIITGNGPEAAEDFGNAILKTLKETVLSS
ncbi:MAG: DJ-1/PfpI family protein [Endomicrobia bacterium]|nr:DJ-1/PfpI family protein [Endomicrobiia bacterium]MCL2506099.1 DJ-1/PfpI family protein [Endomicrobiia bacterium]